MTFLLCLRLEKVFYRYLPAQVTTQGLRPSYGDYFRSWFLSDSDEPLLLLANLVSHLSTSLVKWE